MTASEATARSRLDLAFAREERRGLMVAAGARSAAVAVIVAWLALVNPERGLAYAWIVGSASLFLVTGLAQFWVYYRGAPLGAPYLFGLVDSLALAAVLVLPNPFAPVPLPPALPLRFANFLYFFGPAVLGDIGSERSMAFAAVGDTTNVASRLQALTRDLGVGLVASGALVTAIRRESADAGVLRGLTNRGPRELRGRDTPIEVWAAQEDPVPRPVTP